MILKELLPAAVEADISEREFFHMTMAAVRLRIEKFWKNRKNDWERAEYQAWLTGYYTMYAIGTNFSKKIKYPKNPMQEEQVVVEDMEITEEEADHYREEFVKRLLRMEDRFNKSKEKEEVKGG